MPRKYYSLTDRGKKAFKEVKEEWNKMVKSLDNVLEGGK